MVSPHDSRVFEVDGAHEELYRDRAYYSRLAGISEAWLWQPLSASVGPNEVKYVSRIRTAAESGSYGILYTGVSPGDRLDAICGALVRNFIDARIRPLERVLKDPESAHCTVLIVPDLCVGPGEPPQFVRAAVTSLLFDRLRVRQQTLVYATSPADVKSAYGPAALTHLSEHFKGDPR